MEEYMELENVKGIGPKTKELLNKINIYSVDELVRYYPYRYNIYSPENILNHEDEQICITGMIEGVPKLSYIKRNLNKISFTFLTNNIRCNVVIFNRAFINRYLTVGKYITLVGKYKKDKNQFIASDIKLKPIYEKYHNVILSDNMIDTIINLSERYVFDRNRPDKEIDILDEVSSRVGIRECTNISEINSIKRKLDKLKKEKNGYIIDNNIDKAYEIRKSETKLMALLNEMELNNKKTRNEVVFDDIASVISDRTGVPIDELTDFNGTSVNNMSLVLHNNIIGQDEAIDSLIATTKKIKMGYRDKCYSFLFVGPSGVGKTEMAKRYASLLVGEDSFIRLDMSEYSDATSVNKILGSSPGYVGYDDNRNFLEEVRSRPNCVILLDEIDKAHPSVINLFYQILEEGKIKNAKGVTVRFDNAIIIMTSNSGFERNGIGFNGSNSDNVISGLKCYFNLAFINRLDNVITFNRLGKNDIRYIINNRLDYIRDKYCNIDIILSDNIIDDIIIKSEYEEFGARRVLRIISKYIENAVIDAIINNSKEVVINSLDNKNNITI